MNSKEQQARYERAYQEAVEIIDREWLKVGASREALEQSKQLSEIFNRLLGAGRSMDDIIAEWEQKSPGEILREYATPISPNAE